MRRMNDGEIEKEREGNNVKKTSRNRKECGTQQKNEFSL